MSVAPTVSVVDDDPTMRSSLRWLLESVGLTVRTCASAEEFLHTYQASEPGCLVLDLRMPGMSGLDLQAELASRQNCLPILMISGYAEVPLVIRAMKAGAFAFIEKPFSAQELLDSIHAAMAQNEVARRHRATRRDAQTRLDLLTRREREVLKGVVIGRPNKQIAATMRLSPKTVEVHRARVMEKFKAESLADLVRLWVLATGDDSTMVDES